MYYAQEISFYEYLDMTRYEGFSETISELSDEEFYELEDEYRSFQKEN